MHNVSSDELLENCRKVGAYYQDILTYLLNNKNLANSLKYTNNKKLQAVTSKAFEQIITHPEKFNSVNLEYVQNFQKLIANSINSFIGKPTIVPEQEKKTDRRFKDPEWNQNIYFDFIKQYYLLTSDWMQKSIAKCDLDDDSKKYIQFSATQFIDAVSPANFAFSNPVVIKESLQSGLENIVKGMENFLTDIKKSNDSFNISTTDKSYFEIGKDIAATKGKVIYQNDLIQLIVYKPKKQTHAVPMLLIPPCINKFYILDLSEHNSFVKYLVDNNYQVFLISWVNPKKKHANKDFENYVKEGILDSIDEIQKLGYKKVNTLGYCIGGTLLSIALSYHAVKKNKTINSATFLTTLIDFSNPGEVGALINENTYPLIEKEVNAKGYLDGKYLSNSFSLIRANDLIWSFFVNNYLLGKAPAVFDILYWNSDPTNLPAKMYLYYLKNMYIDNKLKNPDALEMLGTKIDVSKINIPTFSLAAESDHIALWKSVYDSYKLLSGDKTFCLSDAGHVAGVVNPANNSKYSYLISKDVTQSSESWQESAIAHKGSWWLGWKEWLEKHSGILSKSIDYDSLNFIEAAPGTYVKK